MRDMKDSLKDSSKDGMKNDMKNVMKDDLKQDDQQGSNDTYNKQLAEIEAKQDSNKKENKKAIKGLAILVILGALGGGAVGWFSASAKDTNLNVRISELLNDFMYVISPWLVIALAIIGFVAVKMMYNKAKRDFNEAALKCGEGGEIDEMVLNDIDHRISRAMVLCTAETIVSLSLFGVVVAYIDRYLEEHPLILLATFVFFIFSAFAEARHQQLLVDLAKIMYPEKNGSAYDIKFNEKWEESCDEFEKLMIYKASYKAYRTGNMACCIALVATILLSFMFEYGPLPSLMIGAIWLALNISYSLEAMKLDKQKVE